MLDEIASNSLTWVALTNWAPTLFTVGAGGYLASILFPRWQQSYQMSKQRTEKRLGLAEAVAKFFNRYIVAWRRLMQISVLEATRPLSPDEVARKNAFVEDRNEKRDELHDNLNVCHIYFRSETSSTIQEFCRWDEENSVKRLSDLPTIVEWRSWERRVLGALKDDIARNS